MAETHKNRFGELVGQFQELLAAEFQAQAEELQRIEQSVQELHRRQREMEDSIQRRLKELAKMEVPVPPSPSAAFPSPMLEQVLAAVRDLMTATLPEQVLQVLTEEAAKLGVRAAVFDVRGKAAWGSSARGFAELPDKVFRGLVVQLTQEGPFRTCYETAGHLDANAGMLKKNRNILDKLKPDAEDLILLLPIRSAGAVSAIFYADAGGRNLPMPVNALKILVEFAGAQLDRLMAFSGGITAPAEVPAKEPAVVAEPAGAESALVMETQSSGVEPPATGGTAAPPSKPVPVGAPLPAIEQSMAVGQPFEPTPVLGGTIPVAEVSPPPAAAAEGPLPRPLPASMPPVAAPGGDLSQLTEEDQKNHRDAMRFAKLLVSEIELYNKAKVQEGRKNHDLYKRLKADIDRSRQTYEKRFEKTVGKQYDYFHEELVRILAGSDASLLGPDCPGPTV